MNIVKYSRDIDSMVDKLVLIIGPIGEGDAY